MATLLLFSASLALLVLAHADDQSGFISIDCGIPKNSSYTDKITGIKYVSDAEFIDTGELKDISPDYTNRTAEEQFGKLRRFPEGVRNCYTIKLQGGGEHRYLIRVRFMYGNYDNREQPPSFDLFLGVDRWDSVSLKNASNTVTKELIHVPPLDYIQICLINNESGVPFISALEIRPLNNRTYVAASGSLKLLERLDLGSENNKTVRYPDDTYDRIWLPSNLSSSKSIPPSSTTITPNIYAIPGIVLATANTPPPKHGILQLEFPRQTRNKTDRLYIFMHFAEIQNLSTMYYRAFNLNFNGRLWYGPLNLTHLSTITLFGSIIMAKNGGSYKFSLNRTENSTRPPLINAIEIFVEPEFLQLQTTQTEIDALLNLKSTYNVKKNWQGDPCYPKKYLWDGLDCSYIDERQPSITSLNLSWSGLAGEISSGISNLTMIQYLDLSNNRLNGTVPDFLANLSSLRVLNLENNNLSGTIPPELIQESRNRNFSLRAGGNPFLCLPESCHRKEVKKYVVSLTASLGGVILVLLTGGAIFQILRRQKKKAHAGNWISGSEKNGGTLVVQEKKRFTYSEILSIANNFERVIGKGGFGTVYHGYLYGIQVSVKMLSPASVQGYKQFQEEAQWLTRVHHGNLTSILGYCDEDTHLGLVYEHMENGNLADHLSEKSNHILNWKERLRIAQDAAQGLEHLHFGCKPPIIHRDVKSTNILLDGNFHAKLADFGMSKVFQLGDGAQASAAVGTPGYLDPEYTVTNKLSEKSDVYSFGVILLEIVTGRPALTRNQDKTHVIEWVSSVLKEGEIKKIVDPKLGLDIGNSSIWKFIDLAMTCVSPSSTTRPSMNQVVMELKEYSAVLENSQENNQQISSSLEYVPLAPSITNSER